MTTLAQVFVEAGQKAHPNLSVIGPPAWAELHGWAERFAAKVGVSCGCGVFARDATRALHDVVSVHLGKKAMFPETLQEVARMYQEAAKRLNGVSVEAAEDEVNIFHSSRFDRAYWVPAIKKWRVLKYDEHGEVILMVDVATRREARRILQEVAVSALPLCTPSEQKRLERCIQEIKAKDGKVNPWAVCQASLGCRRHLVTQSGIEPWPEGMFDDDEEEEDMFEAKKPHAHLSQSFIDTILHTAVGSATALAVTKALTPTSNIKEGEKPSESVPSLPPVLSLAHVEGDQANVDLGTLLEEIDAILKKPETMGIVDADTLTIVRK